MTTYTYIRKERYFWGDRTSEAFIADKRYFHCNQ
jgi:hypothetical protein